MESKVVLECKQCGKEYDIKEVARIYGRESMVYLLGF